MATPAQRTNTWTVNQWYDQSVAGTTGGYVSPVVGSLWSWGDNDKGQLGQNNRTRYSSPIQIGTNSTWSILNNSGSEAQIALGLKSDGTMWVWGTNANGQLGLNQNGNYISSPTQLPGTYLVPNDDEPYNDRVGTIACRNGTAAIKSDGTLWMMGYNEFGQFGFGSNGDQISSPTQVPGTTWKHITTGRDSGFVSIKTDGTMWSWGRNGNGTLGLGNQTSISSPAQVPGTTWLGITMQAQTTQAIKTDGTLWVWGGNGYGTLGLNNTTSHYSPVQLGTNTTWRNCGVTVGDGQLAFKTDGTLWSWGRNESGDLGLNNRSEYSSPMQVGTDTTWVNATASYAQGAVLATKTDGTLWAWGNNSKGNLGQNNNIQRSSPTQVGNSTNWSNRIGGQYAGGFGIRS